jgi:hypothetical protein
VGSGPSPVLWSFPPTTTFTSFPAAGCWACAAAPAFSGSLVYLQLHEELPLPPFGAQGAPPSLLRVFFVVIAYYSVFFLFYLGGGQSVQGAMLIWPRVVCGSTVCCLAHLVVCVFPSRLGAGVWWWHGSPPGFSVKGEVEMLCMGWGCGGIKVLPLLGGFSCNVYLQHLSQILL